MFGTFIGIIILRFWSASWNGNDDDDDDDDYDGDGDGDDQYNCSKWYGDTSMYIQCCTHT